MKVELLSILGDDGGEVVSVANVMAMCGKWEQKEQYV